MERASTSSAWTEEGYRIFSEQGLEGIQVEPLARILGLNKSGFYHYFGDISAYCAELIALHKEKVAVFLREIGELKTLEPEYLYLLIRHSTTVMFQVHLTRNQSSHSLYSVSKAVDDLVNVAVRSLWCDYIGVSRTSETGIRYYSIIRDMFYTRISFENLNYPFLHNLISEAKSIVNDIADHKGAKCDSLLL